MERQVLLNWKNKNNLTIVYILAIQNSEQTIMDYTNVSRIGYECALMKNDVVMTYAAR